MSRLTYGWLCWSDDAAMLSRDSGEWTLHIEPVRQYLCALANAGVDEVRALPYGVWGPRPEGALSQFSPYVVRDGRFDLLQFNDWYFPIMRRFIQAANEYGLRVRFVWFDNCQLAGGYINPWETNAQGITSFYGKDADAYTRTWIDRCIAEFAGLDVSWALGNETNDPGFIGMAQRVLIPAVRAHNLDPARLYYGATMTRVNVVGDGYDLNAASTVQDLVRSRFAGTFGDSFAHRITREVHGCGAFLELGSFAHQACWWWAGKPVGPFELSDDGEWQGASKCDREDAGHVRPSAEQWTATIKATLCNNISYEHLPKGGDVECQTATLKAMYKAIHGKLPETKYSYVPLPEPEPEPDPQPEPVVKDCDCRYWLEKGSDGRVDYRRWWLCIMGLGPKKCR